MNNDPRVQQLISSILDIERAYIKDRLNLEPVAKKAAVKAILDEVEKVMEHEDQDN